MAKRSSKSSSVKAAPSSSAANGLYGWVWLGIAIYAIGSVISSAYEIRLGAIQEFGPVIHEFDPYFNYRATEVRENSLLVHGRVSFVFGGSEIKLIGFFSNSLPL